MKTESRIFEILTIWKPVYWLSAFVKGVTAASSVCTAVVLLIAADDPEKVLDRTRDGQLKDMKAKLIREKRTTLSRYPGRMMWFEVSLSDIPYVGQSRAYVMFTPKGAERFA